MLDVRKTSVAAAGPKRATCDELALHLISTHQIRVDVEAGIIRTVASGGIADRRGRNGYREMKLLGNRLAQSHRVVWLAAFGPIPPGKWEINHRNRCRDDNRIRNLELVLPIGNQDHARGRVEYLRVGLDDEGAVDPHRLADLLAGLKSQTASKRSKVLPGPNVHGVAVRAARR